jgi:hypothetical protein
MEEDDREHAAADIWVSGYGAESIHMPCLEKENHDTRSTSSKAAGVCHTLDLRLVLFKAQHCLHKYSIGPYVYVICHHVHVVYLSYDDVGQVSFTSYVWLHHTCRSKHHALCL